MRNIAATYYDSNRKIRMRQQWRRRTADCTKNGKSEAQGDKRK
jgi:hypothetical protein